VRKLASSTGELGEQLFGAVSLLRAGGKVLTETAENTQSRLNEAISLLVQSETSLRQMLVQGFEPLGTLRTSAAEQETAREDQTKRLEVIVNGFEAAQRKLEEYFTQQAQAAGAQTEKLATALDDIGERIEQRIAESLSRAESMMQGVDKLSELSGQMNAAVERLTALESGASDNLLLEIKSGFEVTTRSIARLREEFVESALSGEMPAGGAMASAEPAWEKVIEQVVAANDSFASAINQQIDRVEKRIIVMDKRSTASSSASSGGMSPEEAQTQLRQQAQVLSELASALGSIDAHMQEMRSIFRGQGERNQRAS